MTIGFGPVGDVLQENRLALVTGSNVGVTGVMPITTVLKAVQAEVFTVDAEGVEQLLGRAVDVVTEFLQLGITRLQTPTQVIRTKRSPCPLAGLLSVVDAFNVGFGDGHSQRHRNRQLLRSRVCPLDYVIVRGRLTPNALTLCALRQLV